MVKLYYVPRTRSARPRMVLEELGVPYELVRLDPAKGETRTEAHLARQPLGHVPALEDSDGDVRIFESAAICYWLAERYGGGRLLPPPGSAGRAEAYQWLCFALSELEAPLVAISAERRKQGGGDPGHAQAALERFRAAAQVIADVVAERPFLLGGEVSVADYVVGAVLSWGKFLGALEGIPAAAAYLGRMRERPAWKRANAD
jgi:glutathione S-transferase